MWILKESKEYRFCILTIAQAYEVFFSTFLQMYLIYKPFVRCKNIEWMINANKKLNEKIEKLAYLKLRNIFLNLMISKENPINDLDHEKVNRIILELDNLTINPKDEKLKDCDNVKLFDLLLRIKKSKINVQRNKVIHKSAYRPGLEEVKSFIDEAREVIFSLASSLQILDDDVNSYV